MGDAVAQTIQQAVETGHEFTGNNPHGSVLKKIQSGLVCTTYNGQEAGDKLGVSRERVRQLRREHGLPLLLTESHIEVLRERRQRKPSV